MGPLWYEVILAIIAFDLELLEIKQLCIEFENNMKTVLE